MGCLTLFKPVFIITHPSPSTPKFTPASVSISPNSHNSFTCGCRITARGVRNLGPQRHDRNKISCCYRRNGSSMENDKEPHQDAIIKVISEISKAEGRNGRTNTMILGGTSSNDSTYDALSLTKMLNIYPAARGFTAIGSGGDDFVQSMVVAVESVVRHPIPQGKVKQKFSSGGKYVSVNIGPVQIVSSNQVQAVYYAMKRDCRMRYFL